MELNCFHSGVIPADVAAGIWCVDLSHNGIAAIPPSMAKPLTGLQDLNLSHNMISDFPSCLCNLPSLTTLDLSLNLLESIDISAELVHKGLPNLEALLLSKNHLRQLPPCLAGCKSLTKLDLGHNRLGFAMTFGGGSKGNTPRGGETGAGFIPTATMVDPLPGAAHLTELYLNDNGLLQVPNAVWGLKELSLLKLSGNRLGNLPQEIEGLRGSLTILELKGNGIVYLPSRLGFCMQLSKLEWSGNPIRWPPGDVMRLPLPKILEWLRGNDKPGSGQGSYYKPPTNGVQHIVEPPALEEEEEDEYKPPSPAPADDGDAEEEEESRPQSPLVGPPDDEEDDDDDGSGQRALEAAKAKAAAKAVKDSAKAEALALRNCLTQRKMSLADLMKQAAAAKKACEEADAAAAKAAQALEEKREEARKKMEEEQRLVEEAAANVAAIPKAHLDELRQLNNPPKVVMHTLQAVHLLLEAAEPSESSSPRMRGFSQVATKLNSARKSVDGGGGVQLRCPLPEGLLAAALRRRR